MLCILKVCVTVFWEVISNLRIYVPQCSPCKAEKQGKIITNLIFGDIELHECLWQTLKDQ